MSNDSPSISDQDIEEGLAIIDLGASVSKILLEHDSVHVQKSEQGVITQPGQYVLDLLTLPEDLALSVCALVGKDDAYMLELLKHRERIQLSHKD